MKDIARHSVLALAFLAYLSSAARAAENPPQTETSLTLGAGVGVRPAYEGSKQNKGVAVPLLDYQNSNGLFVSTQRGVGWTGGDSRLQYSLAVNGRAERTDQHHKSFDFKSGSDELAGMGTVKSSAVGQVSIAYRLDDRTSLRAGVETPLSHRDNGSTAQVGGEYTLWAAPKDSVALGGALTLADGKYMRTYFGVTPAQSAASGYAPYVPKSGLYKANLNVDWTHRIDSRWKLVAIVGVEHLTGDAGNSPITLRKTAPQGVLLASYAY